MNILCKICQKRRARRHCPGVSGEICAICCGTEREITIDCPLDCEHLQSARRHEPPVPIDPSALPNKDIRVTEDFIRDHEELVVQLTVALEQAMEQEHAVDLDAREALQALIQTYRTLDSGLIYETRPENPYAAKIQSLLKDKIELFQKLNAESAQTPLRDAEILATLVFLQRLELQYSNGRRRGRAFFDFLHRQFPAQPEPNLIA